MIDVPSTQHFTFTCVYLNGWLTPENRETGTRHVLEPLDAYLASTKATV